MVYAAKIEILKIDEYLYTYGSPKADLFVEIMRKEQKLHLQLGPNFNYKKDHELLLSLHSQSKFRIVLHFNVIHLAHPEEKSNDSNHTYESALLIFLGTSFTYFFNSH